MTEFEGKKILFLHAGGITVPLIERAKELGCKTIVANNYPIEQAPAKGAADEAVDIDFSDTDAMVAMMRERHVDGIVTGYADSHLPHYYRLCHAMGFPCYCTMEQIEATTNKLKFKALCRANGVPTVKEYKVSPVPTREELSQIVYPVMVKPADSSGSRGCRPCANEEELLRGIKDALACSAAGQVIVEKYMHMARRDCDDVGIHYIFSRGKAYLANVTDRYTNRTQQKFAPLTAAVIGPSKHLEEYISTVNPAMEKMYGSLGVREGTASVQAFHDGEGFHIYEMGFRFTGGQQWVSVLSETGIDEIRAMIRFALTGDGFLGEPLELCSPKYENYSCNLHFLCSGGTISRIDGIGEVSEYPSVIHVTQTQFVGDTVKADGTLAQVLCRVYIQASTQESLMDKIREIRTRIVAYDEHDRTMMLPVFNPDVETGIR